MFTVLLVLAVVPALLPRTRHVLVGIAAYAAVVLAAVIRAEAKLDSMTVGEGPAFFSAMLLLGAIQILLVVSMLLRAISRRLASRLPVESRTSAALSLLAGFASVAVLAALLHAAGLAGGNLLAAAVATCAPLGWIGVSLLLWPAACFRADRSAAMR
jgi:hypothetical protein